MKIKRMRYSRKRIFLGLFLFLVLLGLGVGFAFVTTKLSIEGVANVKEARWDIHFDNFEAISGSVTPTAEPVVNNDTITFSAKVDEPGNFYGFTFDIVNAGTINAELADFSVTPDFSTIDYIDSTIEYENGNQITIGDLLPANKSKKVKVLLSYKDGIDESLYPTTDQSFNVTLTIKYQQYTNKLTTFADDTWDAIKTNVEKDPTVYPVGDTKTMEMDLDDDGTNETYTLRVVNNTTPAECNTPGFSQTACGFVVEFADVISYHRMNPEISGDTTTIGVNGKGGWEYSDMRAYLNSKVFAYENIDYTSTGIYEKLPNKMKNVILATEVVSGHGYYDDENYITTDKLYLLSTHEVYEDDDVDTSGERIINNDKSYDNTRQLDYYKIKGVTILNYSDSIKKHILGMNSWWWLRSARCEVNGNSFYIVNTDGHYHNASSSMTIGVSPAFRIG